MRLAPRFPNRPRLAAALIVAAPCLVLAGPLDLIAADQFATRGPLSTGRWHVDADLPPTRPALDGSPDIPVTSPALLRIGLSNSVELHARADGLTPPRMMESSADSMRRLHGFTDVSLGATWRVRGGDAGWLPGVAWLADVETNGGRPAFGGPYFRPSLRATAEWRLPQDMTLGLMPGVYRDRDDESGHHYAAGVMAVTLGKSWTPRLRSFVEVAGERLGQSQRDGSSIDFDTGLAFRATQSLQMNMVVSHTLSGTSQSVRAGLSLSSRF